MLKQLFGRHETASAPHSGLMIELTGVVWPEGSEWVSQCVEIDVSSFGSTPQEAIEELKDAIGSYLNTIDELGERERALETRGVPVYKILPTAYEFRVPRSLLDRPGSLVRPFDLSIGNNQAVLA